MTYEGYAFAHHPHDPIDAMAVSPSYNEDKTVFIANSEHLLKSINGGHSWKELVNGLDNIYAISSIEIIPSMPASYTLFISTLGNGIYRSTNGGTSWSNVSAGLQNLSIRKISARTKDIVLALDTAGRLYVSTNRGQLWHTVVTLPQGVVITSVSPPSSFPETRILAGDSLGRILESTDR